MKHLIYKSAIFAICILGTANIAGAELQSKDIKFNPANAVSLDANHPDSFHNYAPELDKMLSRMPKLDPATGLYVEQIEKDLFFVTEGIYQSAFLVTNDGVVVFDAPPSFAEKLPSVISNAAPDTPITHLIYSHGHTDHIGGSAVFSSVPDLKVMAHEDVAESLAKAQDERILVPTEVYSKAKTLFIGGEEIMLTAAQFHAEDQDTMIYLPKQKFLMAVDTITPGEAPFMNFGATADVGAYLESFEQFLAYDFKHFFSGHVSVLGTRDDVVTARDYAFEVRDRVFEGLASFDQIFGKAFAALDYKNANLGYRIAIEEIRDECASQVIKNWSDRLSVVDVWAASHCEQTVLYYIMH